MVFIDPRIRKARDLLREDVPVPVLVKTRGATGATRLRELEAGGLITGREFPIASHVAAAIPGDPIDRIRRLDAITEAWFDEPVYAWGTHRRIIASAQTRFNEKRTRAREAAARVGDLVSSETDLVRRILARRQTIPTQGQRVEDANWLGGFGPLPTQPDSTILTLNDTRDFVNAAPVQRELGFAGQDVTVAVLDTGIDPTHPMVTDAVTQAHSTVPEDPGDDLQGHGTWCASQIAGRPTPYDGSIQALNGTTLQGIAPEASLLDIKVLTGEGTGSMSTILDGIQTAVDEGADIANLSLGTPIGFAGRDPTSQAVENAFEEAGLISCVATGNSFGFATIGAPASSPASISVGSIAMQSPRPHAVSTFSSKGPSGNGLIKPNITAPGGNMGPQEDSRLDEVILGAASGTMADVAGEPWATLRGTSMATPAVAGLLAQQFQQGLPPVRVTLEGILRDAATGPGTRGILKTNRTGWGTLDALELFATLQQDDLPSFPVRAQTRFQERARPIIGRVARTAARLQSFPLLDPFELRLPVL